MCHHQRPTRTIAATGDHHRPQIKVRDGAAVQSAARVGAVVDQLVHGTRHRCGTDRRERGSQPGPNGLTLARHAGRTYKVGPRSSGDRASVS
jgi:hypothetical protein